MPPLINIARTSTPFLSNGQSYQLFHQRWFGFEPHENPWQASTPVISCPVEPKFHRLNQWLRYSPEVSAIVGTKFLGGMCWMCYDPKPMLHYFAPLKR